MKFLILAVIAAMLGFLGSLLLMLSLNASTFSKRLAPLKPVGIGLLMLAGGLLYWTLTHYQQLL